MLTERLADTPFGTPEALVKIVRTLSSVSCVCSMPCRAETVQKRNFGKASASLNIKLGSSKTIPGTDIKNGRLGVHSCVERHAYASLTCSGRSWRSAFGRR